MKYNDYAAPATTKFTLNRDSRLVVTSPAPWNRNFWSESRFFVIRRAASIPATATDAVPMFHNSHTHINLQLFNDA